MLLGGPVIVFSFVPMGLGSLCQRFPVASCLFSVGSFLLYSFGHVAAESVLVGCRGACFFPWAGGVVGSIPEGLGVVGDRGAGRGGFCLRYSLGCIRILLP